MKKYIFTEEQILSMVVALNSLTVTGMEQAEKLVICKQTINAAEVKEDECEKK